MTAVENNPQTKGNSFRRSLSIKFKKRQNIRTDMTPMVDLGFLLITFFVITAELNKPKSMKLFMPHDGPSSNVPESRSLTFLMGADNTVYYYFGEEEKAVKNNTVMQTSWYEQEGIGKIIREKQQALDKIPEGRSSLVVVIKPGERSTYKNAVDMLDEMLINRVTRYAVVKPGEWDIKYLKQSF